MSDRGVRGADLLVLERGALRVEVTRQPFELTVWRGERRVVHSLGAWAADGTIHDHFIALTEGVVAHEELAPRERAVSAAVLNRAPERLELSLLLTGGRRASLEVQMSGPDRQQASGVTWGGDQVSDFWSLRVLVAATLSAAIRGFSSWSHDVGGYLGHRLVERCPPESLVRWLQFGCFTPLMHAHGRMPQEPWRYSEQALGL